MSCYYRGDLVVSQLFERCINRARPLRRCRGDEHTSDEFGT